MKIEVFGGNDLARLPHEDHLLGMEEWAVSAKIFSKSAALSKVFERHFCEHQTTLSYMGEFCIPTVFYVEIVDNQSFYRILQPWIRVAVQYKEAITTGRKLVRRQLPDFSTRLLFLSETAEMVEGIYPELPDFDFFVTEDRGLAVFDTTGFWYERREGKDRTKMAYDISHFLFTEEELVTREICEWIGVLRGGLFGQR